MKKPTPKQSATPDLLTPVQEAMKAMPFPELKKLADDMKLSTQGLKNIRDGDFGRLGPSLFVVTQLYDRLVAQKA